jgi:hypothetical protein
LVPGIYLNIRIMVTVNENKKEQKTPKTRIVLHGRSFSLLLHQVFCISHAITVKEKTQTDYPDNHRQNTDEDLKEEIRDNHGKHTKD